MVNTIELTLEIDGTAPMSASAVERVAAFCDRVHDHGGPGVARFALSGAPGEGWSREVSVGLVTKWERTVRRLEQLPVTTVALVSGDCGGTALDVLLTADVRVATPGTRLILPVAGGATWPGMTLYRLVQQAGAGAIRRAVLLGAPIDADRAVAARLLDEVTDDPSPVVAGDRELAVRRLLLSEAATTSFEEALGAHLAACDRALRKAAVS
ncbi:enoyl-CoA-hydratase DpgB [Herbidospora daliensis]|uniref:enoyl-CoA-hydratase DpgB n=1 Tax=Herbidospora daliensis TaxID=295585 RepID=UPI000785C664